MGFWDFIAPDFESFREVSRDVVPDYVAIPPVVLSQDDLIALAWANPGSGAGLALRLYYTGSQLAAGGPALDALVSSAINQGTAGGFDASNGFGGSFGWQSGELMPVLVIPNVYRVSIEAQCGVQAVTNVIGVRAASAGQAEEVATAVDAGWRASGGALSILPGAYVLQRVRAMDLSSAAGEIAEVATGGAGFDTTNQIATAGACALVKWNGGTRSRSSRGRMYLGPLTENRVDADGRTVLGAAVPQITEAVEKLRAAITTAGFTHCVISPTLGTASDIATFSVESTIATQRRRIRG